jgi:hypothetical protein
MIDWDSFTIGVASSIVATGIVALFNRSLRSWILPRTDQYQKRRIEKRVERDKRFAWRLLWATIDPRYRTVLQTQAIVAELGGWLSLIIALIALFAGAQPVAPVEWIRRVVAIWGLVGWILSVRLGRRTAETLVGATYIDLRLDGTAWLHGKQLNIDTESIDSAAFSSSYVSSFIENRSLEFLRRMESKKAGTEAQTITQQRPVKSE